MLSDFPQKYMPIIPTYSDIFGCKPTLNELINIIKQTPVFEWQSFLSRMQSIVGGDQFQNKNNHQAVFHGNFSKELKKSILDFVNKKPRSEGLYICYERQLSTLQQLAFLYAPDDGFGSFDDEKGRDKLGIALLMVLDLMAANVAGADNDSIVAALIQEQIRMAQTPYWVYFARAVMFYELDVDVHHHSHCIKEYLSLFQKAVGVDPFDHMMGGLVIAAHEITRSIEQQASAWKSVSLSEQLENPNEKRIVRAFEKIRCATLWEMRRSILRREKDVSVSDYNLISLYRFPLVTFPPKGTFVINLTSLGRSLFDGVRHAILTAALEGRLPDGFNKLKRLGGLYGQLFERYVMYILKTAFSGRVVKISESDFPGNADCLIYFPGKVLVVEIKSEHFVATRHCGLMTIQERRSEIGNRGILKGIHQIESTIKGLREYTLKPSDLPSYDWTITPIIPLIITEEPRPSFPLCWKLLYDEFDKPLRALQNGSGKVGRLRILSLEDIELVPSLTVNIDFATLLLRWGNDSEKFEYSFRNYLHSSDYHFSDDFMRENWNKTFRLFAIKLGFDPSKF